MPLGRCWISLFGGGLIRAITLQTDGQIVKSNEGKCCDAVLRTLEEQHHAKRLMSCGIRPLSVASR